MLGLHLHSGGGAAAPSSQMLVIDTFFADGTWTSPAHAGNAVVRGWGGGAGNVIDTSSGGGGAYAQLNSWAFAASTGYTVTVGPGGASDGGNTTLDTSALVAEGGYRDSTAGLAANSTGDVKYDGGAGVVAAGNQNGGGGAGSQGAASGTTPGEPDGGIGGTAAVAGRILAGGAGSHATAQRWGHRGELRVEYDTPATAGFPRLRGYAVGRRTSLGTSHPIEMPAGIEAGDLLVCIFACDATSGGASMSGWTELFEHTESGASQVTFAVYYKTAVGGDTGTVTTASSRWSGHTTLRIANAGTPTATVTDGTSTNADPPSHDAGSSQKYLWLALACWDGPTSADSSGSFLGAVPSGFGNAITVGCSGASPAIAVAMRLEEVQTKNPAAFTSGTEQWVAATVAIPFAA